MRGVYFLGVLLVVLGGCDQPLSEKEKSEYTERGKEIASGVFSTLSAQLTHQMKTGGTIEAIPYCSVTAVPLTEELAANQGVVIKRSSDKIRNSKNNPTDRERAILAEFKTQLDSGSEILPLVELDADGNPHFYAPIRLQEKCLACHGEVGKSVTQQTHEVLRRLYPEDQALGYKEGDLRGLWSITFKN
jgi:hypothetical protein